MKAREMVLFLILLLIISGCTFIGKKDMLAKDTFWSMELSKVVINNEEIDSLIAFVIREQQTCLNNEDCFLLIEKIKCANDTNNINIMIHDKANFRISCPDNDYPILGYLEVNNQIALIVGNLEFDKINYLIEKKTFVFKCKRTYRKGVIPPPPPMSNYPFYTFPYQE